LRAVILVLVDPVVKIESLGAEGVKVFLANGFGASFDTLYPMVGVRAADGLLKNFKITSDDNELLWVDEHQCTSVSGLYAAGDVVLDLNQMAAGTCHADTARRRSTIFCRLISAEMFPV